MRDDLIDLIDDDADRRVVLGGLEGGMPGLGEGRRPLGDQQAQRGQRLSDVGPDLFVGGDRPADRQGRQRLPDRLIAHVRAVELHHPGVRAAGDALAHVVEHVGFAAAGHADHPGRPAADLAEQGQGQR